MYILECLYTLPPGFPLSSGCFYRGFRGHRMPKAGRQVGGDGDAGTSSLTVADNPCGFARSSS